MSKSASIVGLGLSSAKSLLISDLLILGLVAPPVDLRKSLESRILCMLPTKSSERLQP
jgi:hypothetical protein